MEPTKPRSPSVNDLLDEDETKLAHSFSFLAWNNQALYLLEQLKQNNVPITYWSYQ